MKHKVLYATAACLFALCITTSLIAQHHGDVHFDVSVPQNTTPLPAGTSHIDRWGYPIPAPRGGSPEQICNSGFNLQYDDVLLNTNEGFDHPTLGAARQATACAVMDYIASVIDLNGTVPVIRFTQTPTAGNNTSGPLGSASAFFPVNLPPGAPVGGTLHDYIITGTNPLSPGLPHATIFIDFRNVQIGNSVFPIHNDYNFPSSTTNGYDLFSIILHEMTHTLGFFSGINQNGHASMNPSNGTGGPFSLFDRYVVHSGNNLIDPNSPYDFIGSVPWLTSNNLKYDKLGNTGIYTIYAPAGFNSGSSLSHFDAQADNWNYIMNPFGYPAQDIRQYTQPEIEVLCNLGYTLVNVSWGCNDHYPIGVDDNATTPQGTPVCVNVITNDYDADSDPVAILQGSVTVINGGTATISGNQICFTPSPNFCGPATITYTPYETNYNRPGNVTTLTVTVTCTQCPGDPCNYICNGSFELGNPVNAINQVNGWFNTFTGCNSTAPFWTRGMGSPDHFAVGTNNPQSGIPSNIITNSFIGSSYQVPTFFSNSNDISYTGVYNPRIQSGNTSEGLVNEFLNPLPQGLYTLTFRAWAIQHSDFPTGPAVVRFGFNPAPNCANLNTSNNTFAINGGVYQVPTNNQWNTYTATVNINQSGITHFYIEGENGNDGPYNYIYLDHFSLTQAVPLTITKTVDDPNPGIGQQITYTIVVCNNGTNPISNVQVNDLLPTGITYVSGMSSYPNHTFPNPIPGNGGCETLQVVATVTTGAPLEQTITNCATITNPSYCANQVTACADILIDDADISILKSVNAAQIGVGNPVVYTIQITNNGTNTATGVVVNDLLPSCITYQNVAFSGGSGTYNPGTGDISMTTAIAPLQTVIVTINGTLNASGPCTNCANYVTASPPDGNSYNNSSCVTINNNPCTGDISVYNMDASTFITLYNGGSPIFSSVQNIYIDGVFTVDVPLTFFGCPNILMGPNARIDVQPAITLTLDNSVLQAGCNDMWDGIYVHSDNAEVVAKRSTFYDALNAIYSKNGGDFNINDCNFRRCYIGIKAEDFASGNISSWVLSGSIFETAGSLLPPHSSMLRSYAGVYAVNSGNNIFTITPSISNVFDQVNVGIWGDKCNLTVGNNKFINIAGNPAQPYPTNVGIWTTNVATGPVRNLIAGGSTSLSNLFTSCASGIYSDKNINLSAGFNTLVNCNYGISSWFSKNQVDVFNNSITGGEIAINFANNSNATLKARHNTIQNPKIGIDFQFNLNSILQAEYNTILSLNNGMQSNGLQGTGIMVDYSSLSQVVSASIRGNFIHNPRYGIFLRNLQGASSSNHAVIKDNTINFTFSYVDILNLNTTHIHGIRMEGTRFCTVEMNLVERVTNPEFQLVNKLVGISTKDAKNCKVYANTLSRMGNGLYIINGAQNSLYNCNYMYYNRSGINFSNALMTDQAGSFAANNEWVNNLNANRSMGTLGQLFNYRHMGSSGNQYSPLPISSSLFGFINVIPNIGVHGCFELYPPGGGGQEMTDGQRDMLLEDIVSGSVEYVAFEERQRTEGRKFAYDMLHTYPELMQMGTGKDTLYQSFYETESTTDIGTLTEVQQAAMSDPNQAESLNQGVVGENLMLDLQRQVNELYLTHVVGDSLIPFSPADSITLWYIANLHSLIGGPAVYDARAMLHTDIEEDSIADPQAKMAGSGVLQGDFTLQPNPSRDRFTLTLAPEWEGEVTVQVYDMTGRCLLSGNYKMPTFTIMHAWAAGLYTIKVHDATGRTGMRNIIVTD